VETVRVLDRGGGPPTFALAPRPGELPVAVWRLDHAPPARGRQMAHIHDFPMLVFSADAQGTVPAGGHDWPVAAGDLFVVAPGEVIGPIDTPHAVTGNGWSVSFTAEALGADVPGSALAWRTHPLLFPFVRGRASGVLRLTVPAADRPAWTARVGTLARELSERADGYREAVLAHLTLLLVEVARLAADVVDDLRINHEPLLADVFAVIERRYPEALSLSDVARAVNLSPGHLTTVVRRRTGRTVQEWIVDRRMATARRLLAGSDLPVGEIGRRVGYPDPGYFARVFGQAHGMSPTRWRSSG
jgi:AraC-like DNA-binding protein